MRVAIAGGHGQIALRLAQVLSRRGDEVVALIRNPDHADDVRRAGAEPAVVDLEHASEDDIAQAIAGADAVVFAAGAGPGSGSARKETMDYGGAVKLIAAAKQAGVGRYVIVSSMGADPDLPGDDTFSVYQRAKGRADDAVRASGLDATVVRPGSLTNDPGTGSRPPRRAGTARAGHTRRRRGGAGRRDRVAEHDWSDRGPDRRRHAGGGGCQGDLSVVRATIVLPSPGVRPVSAPGRWLRETRARP